MKKQKLKFILRTDFLSAWLKNTREELQISQARVAEETKTSLELLYNIERGDSVLINTDMWKRAYDFYVANGATPLPADKDPIATMPDVAAMRKEIEEMKKATKSSLKEIAASLNVGFSSLASFMKGNNLRVTVAYALRDSLARLKTKPADLLEEGVLQEKTIKDVKPRKERRSLIESAPDFRVASQMPSSIELDLREFELIQRLRQHISTNEKPKQQLNGRHRH